MDQTQWSAFYPQIGYIGTWQKTVVPTFLPCHLPYHEIHHFWPSINLRGCHFPLRGQTLFIPSYFLSLSILSSHWTNIPGPFHFWTCVLGTYFLGHLSCVLSSATTWETYPWAVGNGRQLPAGYILAKSKEAFRSGRPIISFVDAPFRPMLNILARLIFQLIPVACPDHFASGDVYTLLSILKSAPVGADLILANQDLAGFFNKHRSRTFRECLAHALGLPPSTYGCIGQWGLLGLPRQNQQQTRGHYQRPHVPWSQCHTKDHCERCSAFDKIRLGHADICIRSKVHQPMPG